MFLHFFYDFLLWPIGLELCYLNFIGNFLVFFNWFLFYLNYSARTYFVRFWNGLRLRFNSMAQWMLHLGECTLEKDVCSAAVGYAAAAAKSLQSCPTLGDPIDGSPPGSPVPGILQARALEWVASSFSNAGKWKVKVKPLSRASLSDPTDGSPSGSPVHGVFQTRALSGVPLPSLTVGYSVL